MKIKELVKRQKEYFKSGITLDIDFRKRALKKLYKTIKDNEQNIYASLKTDLNKSDYETYMCEMGLVLSEISYMLKHIESLSGDKRVLTPLSQFHAHSYIKKEPFGTVLIMAPWNYPFLLSIEPLVDAIAAGNTAIIKPSELSPNTSELIGRIIRDNFDEEYIAVVNGGIETANKLLDERFDMIFFTGSTKVGKIVAEKASHNLIPCVLELGGKSPCVVDEEVNIKLAAKRIVFGKFLNAGQTCVAPDYVFCHKSIKDELVKEIVKQIEIQYQDALNNDDYVNIVSEKHLNRLLSLIDKDKVVYGGNYSELKIEPTVIDKVSFDDEIMKEEIFGPLLPILSYERYEDIIDTLNKLDKPLALYIFSDNKKHIKELSTRLSYGGGCINDTVIHLASSRLPFGGVGNSGMGMYHGKYGFEAFSHLKSIVDKKNWLDLPMRYQKYNRKLYFW
ncbi:MAG: aldehyde dehydrogenase, partial [Erysipelotrichaceae bacterium]